MNLQGLPARYKLLPQRKRIALSVVAVGVATIFWVLDTIPTLVEQLEQKQSNEQRLQHSVSKLQETLAQLESIEMNIAELEQEIESGKKMLPETVSIDQILSKTAIIAQESGVKIHRFSPREPLLNNGEFRYFQIPIGLELSGTYSHITAFFDKLVHLDILFHLQNISFALLPDGKTDTISKDSNKGKIVALTSRKLLNASVELLAFRAATTEEIAQSAIAATGGQ